MSLNITVIQSNLYWENPVKNIQHFTQEIAAITAPTDIIVLPEMFNTGFSMESEKLAEKMNGETVSWMQQMASSSGAVIVGSVIIEEHEEYYNRLIWAEPQGDLYTYDKRHLFRMAQEDQHFSPGKDLLIVQYKGWRICPLICYDLRFPVWSRNVDEQGNNIYDCLIYVANWPAARKSAWSTLLRARAMENQCYVVGVNRIGSDAKAIDYSGNTAIIDPKGEYLSNIPENTASTQSHKLSLEQLNEFREKFPVVKDADKFNLL